MVKSGLKQDNCRVGDELFCCLRWLNRDDKFEEVRVVGRNGSHVRIKFLTGPRKNEPASAFASQLWSREQYRLAEIARTRDLQIRDFDEKNPIDDIEECAIRICWELVAEDYGDENVAATQILLARLGRQPIMDRLHELAYAEDDGTFSSVHAPRKAWRDAMTDLVRGEPHLADAPCSAISAQMTWEPAVLRAAALVRIRVWAGIPQVSAPLAPSMHPGPSASLDARITGLSKRMLTAQLDRGRINTSETKKRHQRYRDGHTAMLAEASTTTWEWRRDSFASSYADFLLGQIRTAIEEPMTAVARDIGVLGIGCLSIVWSDYNSQRPRTLHLFPDGPSFCQDWVYPFDADNQATTACGQRFALHRRSDRGWYRAHHGEWWTHFQALQRARATSDGDDDESAEHDWRWRTRFSYNWDLARRICEDCAEYHGLSFECFEQSDEGALFSPWTTAVVNKSARSNLVDKLIASRPVGSSSRALNLASTALLSATIEELASAAKRLGPGTLDRIFRYERNPYHDPIDGWNRRVSPLGLESHELISRPMWQVLAIDVANSRLDSGPGRDAISTVDRMSEMIEARLSGLTTAR